LFPTNEFFVFVRVGLEVWNHGGMHGGARLPGGIAPFVYCWPGATSSIEEKACLGFWR
jgi:hypothetical protein